MLVTAIWHILKNSISYSPDGFIEERKVRLKKVLSVTQSLHLLKKRGYVIQKPAT